MSTVVIELDGVDITASVKISTAVFNSAVNGVGGTCSFEIRDLDHAFGPVVGKPLTVSIDGSLKWAGYALSASRQYGFAVDDTSNPAKTERMFLMEGVDNNVLFQKRVVWNKDHPTHGELPPPSGYRCSATRTGMWAEDTPTDVIIPYLIENYTSMFDDGVTMDVDDFGSPMPDDCGAVSGGVTVGEMMSDLNRSLSGVWYLTPDYTFRYHAADTVTTDWVLTDKPSGDHDIGPRAYSFLSDGTHMVNDALVWATALGWDTVTFSRAQDNDNSSSVSSITDHGRWQYGEFNTQMHRQATVDERAHTIVYGLDASQQGARWDQVVVEATTSSPVFALGDVVTCKAESYTGTLREPFNAPDGNGVGSGVLEIALPVRRMRITFLSPTEPRFDLVLTRELDDPFSAFESRFPPIRPIRIPRIDVPQPGFPGPSEPPTGCTCGSTDAFERTEASEFGLADCGIPWVTTLGTGYTFSVGGGQGHAIGGPSTGLDGSVDLPLPIGTFTVMGTLTDYDPDTLLGWINLTTPGFESDHYLYLDPSTSYVALLDGSTDDSASFSFTGNPLNFKIQVSDAGTLARLWYVGDDEPGSWAWVSPSGGVEDAYAVSFQPDDNGMFNVSELHVYDHSFQELTQCGLLIDDFERASASGWGFATPGGQEWTDTAELGTVYSVEDGKGKAVFDDTQNGEMTLAYVPTLPLDMTFLGVKFVSTDTTAMPFTPPNVVAFEFTDFGNGLEVDITKRGLIQGLIGSYTPIIDLNVDLATTDGVNVRVVSTDGKSDLKLWAWLVGGTMPASPQVDITGLDGVRDLTTLKVFTAANSATAQTVTLTIDGIGLNVLAPECTSNCADTDSFDRADTVEGDGLGTSDYGAVWEESGFISGNVAEAPASLQGESRLPVTSPAPFMASIVRVAPSDPDIDGADPTGQIKILTTNGFIAVSWTEVLSGSDWTLTELHFTANASALNGYDDSLAAEVYPLNFPFTVTISFDEGLATATVDGHALSIDYTITEDGMAWPTHLTGYVIGQNE